MNEVSGTDLSPVASIGRRLMVHDLDDVEAIAASKLDGLESDSR